MNDSHDLARQKHNKLRQNTVLPSIGQQTSSLLVSTINFARNGFKMASEEIFQKRKAVCIQCSFWDQNAFYGMGRCLKCGCSSAKLKLDHEKCPIGNW